MFIKLGGKLVILQFASTTSGTLTHRRLNWTTTLGVDDQTPSINKGLVLRVNSRDTETCSEIENSNLSSSYFTTIIKNWISVNSSNLFYHTYKMLFTSTTSPTITEVLNPKST